QTSSGITVDWRKAEALASIAQIQAVSDPAAALQTASGITVDWVKAEALASIAVAVLRGRMTLDEPLVLATLLACAYHERSAIRACSALAEKFPHYAAEVAAEITGFS
ncbi:MAG: hypothetical protein AB7G88_03345, partial [Thermomicrobiales bacterium]